jgi:hypothetical protein
MPNTYAKPHHNSPMPHDVYRPKKSTFWYIRAARPTALNHLPGIKDFRKSTGQQDKKKAELVAANLAARQWEKWLLLLEEPCSVNAVVTFLSSKLVTELCALRLYAWLESDDDFRREGLTAEELAESEACCELSTVAILKVLTQGPAAPNWSAVAGDALEWADNQGYQLQHSDPFLPDYVRAFARVEADAQAAIASRNKGREATTPQRPTSELSWSLSCVITSFLEHKGPKKETKHVQTIINAWKLFIEHCGDLSFDAVTSNHIYEFMVSRMTAERKPWSRERAHGFGQRSLREVFGFARTKGMMKNLNPVPPNGLEAFPVVAQSADHQKPRLPFSSVQLNTLFASAWYEPTESKVFQGKMRWDLGARYWTPLIGTLHGNRVREGVQLVASDIVKEGGILFLRYRVEVDKGATDKATDLRSLKNTASHRDVPLHPKLIELGFEQFVEMRRRDAGPNAWLFPSCVPNKESESPKLGRSYEQAFLRFVRDRLDFGNGFGNHSFRHLVEDKVRSAQAGNGTWPAGLAQQYTGRESVRPQDKGIILEEGSEKYYGQGFTPSAMLPYIQQLDFSELHFPPPFSDWIKRVR